MALVVRVVRYQPVDIGRHHRVLICDGVKLRHPRGPRFAGRLPDVLRRRGVRRALIASRSGSRTDAHRSAGRPQRHRRVDRGWVCAEWRFGAGVLLGLACHQWSGVRCCSSARWRWRSTWRRDVEVPSARRLGWGQCGGVLPSGYGVDPAASLSGHRSTWFASRTRSIGVRWSSGRSPTPVVPLPDAVRSLWLHRQSFTSTRWG